MKKESNKLEENKWMIVKKEKITHKIKNYLKNMFSKIISNSKKIKENIQKYEKPENPIPAKRDRTSDRKKYNPKEVDRGITIEYVGTKKKPKELIIEYEAKSQKKKPIVVEYEQKNKQKSKNNIQSQRQYQEDRTRDKKVIQVEVQPTRRPENRSEMVQERRREKQQNTKRTENQQRRPEKPNKRKPEFAYQELRREPETQKEYQPYNGQQKMTYKQSNNRRVVKKKPIIQQGPIVNVEPAKQSSAKEELGLRPVKPKKEKKPFNIFQLFKDKERKKRKEILNKLRENKMDDYQTISTKTKLSKGSIAVEDVDANELDPLINLYRDSNSKLRNRIYESQR